MARSLGARKAGLLCDTTLPAALPRVFSGFQIAFPLATVGVVAAEMYMGGGGVGGAMMMGGRYADSVGVCAGILSVGLLGVSLTQRHLKRCGISC